MWLVGRFDPGLDQARDDCGAGVVGAFGIETKLVMQAHDESVLEVPLLAESAGNWRTRSEDYFLLFVFRIFINAT
jgi:hypothetical protein